MKPSWQIYNEKWKSVGSARAEAEFLLKMWYNGSLDYLDSLGSLGSLD